MRPLTAAGLRGPDGRPLPSDDDLPPLTAAPFDVLGPHHVDHVLATAYAEDRRADVLVAVDVSGSMRALVPATAEPRIALVRRSVTALAGLLPDDARLSLWAFGTHLDGDRDYRVLRPDGDLEGDGRRRSRAPSTRSPRPTPVPACTTPCSPRTGPRRRPTARARRRTRSCSPTAATRPTTPRSPSTQLRDALKAAADPRRPVNLAVITFGAEPDAEALQKALEPVQGYVDRLTTADEVGAAFIHLAAGGLHG